MIEKSKKEKYCTFCQETESLKEFKAMYVCEECIDAVIENQLDLNNGDSED